MNVHAVDEAPRQTVPLCVRRFGLVAFLFLLSRPAVSQDVIVAAYGSSGLYPAMASSYVCRYAEDLHSAHVLMSYPKLSGSPSAALMVGDVLFVGEGNCTRVPGTPDYVVACAPRLVRFDQDGTSIVFERVLTHEPRSIRLSAFGDLVVTTQGEVVRFDRASGRARAAYPLSIAEHQVVVDADVDRDGCSVAIATTPDGVTGQPAATIVRGDACRASPAWTISAVSTPLLALRGIRFLPDGTLLASGTGVVALDSGGGVIRTYDTPSSGCLLDVNRSGDEAVLACDAQVLRFNLESGEISATTTNCGIGALSINIVQAEPEVRPRRRAVGH